MQDIYFIYYLVKVKISFLIELHRQKIIIFVFVIKSRIKNSFCVRNDSLRLQNQCDDVIKVICFSKMKFNGFECISSTQNHEDCSFDKCHAISISAGEKGLWKLYFSFYKFDFCFFHLTILLKRLVSVASGEKVITPI